MRVSLTSGEQLFSGSLGGPPRLLRKKSAKPGHRTDAEDRLNTQK